MDRLLIRYWFNTAKGIGIGVTAYSLEDAQNLIADASKTLGIDFVIDGHIENVDVRSLDQNHVILNMGPVNVRGLWFPSMNIHRA